METDVARRAYSDIHIQACNLDEPAEQLHDLPLIDFPSIIFGITLLWQLPGGRSALDHHLFPLLPEVLWRRLYEGSYSCLGCVLMVLMISMLKHIWFQ